MANKDFQADFRRMTGKEYTGHFSDIVQILLRHNLHYMWLYRKYNAHATPFRRYKLRQFSKKYGIEIRPKQCGAGLYLGHPYNITVGSNVVIGKNCNLHKGCTIGAENRGKRLGSPTLGDRVYVGINATIIGNVRIGNDVMIAPNSFVNFDVPDHSIVLGNPASIHHKENATEGYIAFCD